MSGAQAAFGSVTDLAANSPKPHPDPLFIKHALLILPVVVVLSIVVLFLSYLLPPGYRAIRNLFRKPNYEPLLVDEDFIDEAPPPIPQYMPTEGLRSDVRRHFNSLREYGLVLFFIEVLRLSVIGALLGLSIYAAILADAPAKSQTFETEKHKHWGHGKKKHKGHHDKPVFEDYSHLEWEEFGVCVFYTYCLFFAFICLCLKHTRRVRRRLNNHIDALLLLAWALYVYRDIWPLCTYNLQPSDELNPMNIARLVLLTVAAGFIPLIRPRRYVPVDPLNPVPRGERAPEQTAPLLSFVLYEYMTPLVWRAWRSPSLPYEQLDPLADYDRADYLDQKYVKHLDPIERKNAGHSPRHLMWLLLWAFRRELCVNALMCMTSSTFDLAVPLGLNQLLVYIETDGEGATIRPMFWVVFLFLGPLLGSLAIQFYVFTWTRALVRGESILTQLLFNHALRLRMKDTVENEDEKTTATDTGPQILVSEADGVQTAASEALQEATFNGTEAGAQTGGDSNGKAPEPVKQAEAAAAKDAGKPSGQGIVGKINVLMAADVESLLEGRDFPLIIVYTPVQFALATWLLWRTLSWSAFVGMFTTIVTLPLPSLLTKWNANIQTERMTATDVRVDSITEAVGALRMIKMFGWESRIEARIAGKREDELQLIWKRRVVQLITNVVNWTLPSVVMAITFLCYTLVEKKPLTAAKVFTSMTVFESIKGLMFMSFYLTNSCITAWVSVKRINKFLLQSEMIDEFSEGTHIGIKTPAQVEAEEQRLVRIKNATFTWGPTSSTDASEFRLRIPDLTFVKGRLNLITGPTGGGKSSLLKALVGELHFERKEGAFFHLPREGGVSYLDQASWCMSDSIKENILFGTPYDEARYKQVLHNCALLTDLKLFDDGDETEIGEKGVTLSGGQKARITLARAIYAHTDIVLLDDVFSALDTLTCRWLIDHLFNGSLVQGRTIIMVTHHVHLAASVADFLVRFNENGTIAETGPLDSTMVSESSEDEEKTVEEMKDAQNVDAQGKDQKSEGQTSKHQLIKDEEKSEGRISKRAMLSFFSTFGGPVFWVTFWSLLLLNQGVQAFQTYWLGLWARAYDQTDDPRSVNVPYWFGLFLAWMLVSNISASLSALLYYVGAFKASREIHRQLVKCIFSAYMRFIDTTPIGRIISRFTKDMRNVDGAFVDTFEGVAEMTIGMIFKFVLVVSFVPLFTLPAVAIGAIGGFLGEMYIHGQLSVKREQSNAKSPLFSHFSAAVSGIVSIRAYGAQAKLQAEARRKADKYTRAGRAFFNLNRWITVRVDLLGQLFSACLAGFMVLSHRYDASTAGFILTQSLSLSTTILWWVRSVNELEVQGNSIERVYDYLVIPQEPAETKKGQPPAAWPTSGEIVLDKLCAKYSEDGPQVLKELDVRIASGEKVGIVGRTGSGKSTLALAILRMVPTSGSVVIDGIKTDNLNLNALRSNVTIIPQDPILLSGSMRFNLDPFGDHDDATLNDALQASGLGQVRHAETGSATPQRLTLDFPIAAGGGNLSQGQRQLVALARALVRSSKVLILDEATASVDFETDTLIQKSIRNLPSSTTVLTVAHRLSTVMDYDKILVLGAGKVLEFDSPENLKNQKDSYFAKLVQAMDG